jgi:hypothetical protein
MAVTKIKPVKSGLKQRLDYIQNPDKTNGEMLVSSFGCSYETTDAEFRHTLSKRLFSFSMTRIASSMTVPISGLCAA